MQRSSWRQQLLLLQGRREEGRPLLPSSNPTLTLPPYSWPRPEEEGRTPGALELDLATTVENVPLEGLGVELVIWHSSQMKYFSFVPLSQSIAQCFPKCVPQNICSARC